VFNESFALRFIKLKIVKQQIKKEINFINKIRNCFKQFQMVK
jgi:hypothetical protein